jgi:hypothetical protein
MGLTEVSCFHSGHQQPFPPAGGTQLCVYLLVLVTLFVQSACQPTQIDENVPDSFLAPSVTKIRAVQKILFIGNSFTYYNGGIDKHLEKLAASASPPIGLVVESQTNPSQTLQGHYRDEATDRALARRSWDVVVLQGASYAPVLHSSQQVFFEFSRRLGEKVKETGAQTAFFMTWAWKSIPGMTSQLSNAYTRQGNEIGALVVPVGLAWQRALQERPEISLYSDQRHSNINGTYLAACVFYSALLGRSPVELAYTAGIEYGDALYLQQLAWKTTQSFYRR